jgi:endonuclease III-like uncharacterized protein
MKDLEKNELIQIINFYKQKSSDLELEYLISQIKLSVKKTDNQSEPMIDL